PGLLSLGKELATEPVTGATDPEDPWEWLPQEQARVKQDKYSGAFTWREFKGATALEETYEAKPGTWDNEALEQDLDPQSAEWFTEALPEDYEGVPGVWGTEALPEEYVAVPRVWDPVAEFDALRRN